MPYHYADSGLDDVFLENGYEFVKTPYGEGVSIQDAAGLHRAIASWIVSLPKPIDGAELRFLRKEMELTQRDLAACIGATEQTLRLWEKYRNKAIQGPADRLVRLLYLEFIGGEGSVRRMVMRLAEPNQVDRPRANLRETENGWQVERDLVPA